MMKYKFTGKEAAGQSLYIPEYYISKMMTGFWDIALCSLEVDHVPSP
jgi:hypothetical protein